MESATEAREVEYIPGIDEPLPRGERLLWTGQPALRPLLLRGLYLRWALVYWGVLAALWLGHGVFTGRPGAALAADLTWLLLIALVGSGLLAALAVAVVRSSRYAITDRRVVLHTGVAFPSVLNLPLEELAGSDWVRHPDGSGDITFEPLPGRRIGVALLWPHYRPGHWRHPHPSFRAIPDVEVPARILREAVQ